MIKKYQQNFNFCSFKLIELSSTVNWQEIDKISTIIKKQEEYEGI